MWKFTKALRFQKPHNGNVHHPQNNLPNFNRNTSSEKSFIENFLDFIPSSRFFKCFKYSIKNEFAVYNHGITDIVFVFQQNKSPLKRILSDIKLNGVNLLSGNKQNTIDELESLRDDIQLNTPEIWGIEAKMKNWKSAVRQAYRYKNFSDRSIVLMPNNVAKKLQGEIELFKSLEVGLWGFDKSKQGLFVYYMPMAEKPRSERAREKIGEKIFSK